MKLLIHSNGPKSQTGYGVEVALLARRLKAAGHDVAISAYYGQQCGIGEWEGIKVYPCSGESYGNDILPLHALDHFDGDPLGGWIIPLMDVFGLTTPVLNEFNIAAWTPVDHFPVPDAVREFFTRTKAVPIAMSKWGEDQLRLVGLDPLYAPLAVDTNVFTRQKDAKARLNLTDRFVVTMNAMNKGWWTHRKGYPEAFMGFAQFAKQHPEAILYVHAEKSGQHAQGINLVDLAIHSGVPEHQLAFCDQYEYVTGQITPEHLAIAYSASDVLLAPSRGEGFCLPLVEAQACGCPVIVTDFSAQPELVGAGWKVSGQPEWETAQTSWLIKADIAPIVEALETCYARDAKTVKKDRALAIAKAKEYDADRVFAEHWVPILADLEGGQTAEVKDRIPEKDGVAVIVPVLDRPRNVAPLLGSFRATTNGDDAALYFICDDDDLDQIRAIEAEGGIILPATHGSTFAQKVNAGVEQTTEPWVFLTGDDVKFYDGWIDAARKVSDRFDVIGTNDHPDGTGNPRVAAGGHSDHFFVRRAYIDDEGASLEGAVAHEGYKHFYVDVEIVELAKARGVFTPCLESVVEHLHPDLGKADIDSTYQLGWGERARDEAEWKKRAPLVAMQRVGLGKVRAA